MMRWIATTLVAFLFSGLLSTSAYSEVLTLRSGTVVVVKTTRAYTSEKVKSDELADLIVGADVLVDGKVVIREGTPVSGSIEEAQSAEMLGREGQLAISINTTRAVDGWRATDLRGRAGESPQPVHRLAAPARTWP